MGRARTATSRVPLAAKSGFQLDRKYTVTDLL